MQRSACLPISSASTSVRPLSSSTRWNSRGPSSALTPVHSDVYGFIRSPVEERGSSCSITSRSRHSAITFSIPITVTSTSGSVVQKRPLPSDSTTHTAPVSATAKLAPLTPIRAERNFARRYRRAVSASSVGSEPSASPRAIVPANSSRISSRLRWIAGTRMCEGRSSASWTMSSARSVSSATTPACSSASLRPISSVAIDFTLTTSSNPWSRAIPATIPFASAASRAQWTVPPAAATEASSRSSCSGRVARARALIAAPASRRSCQSGSSPTTDARLARIVAVALPRLRRSWASSRATAAAAANPSRQNQAPAARLGFASLRLTVPPKPRRGAPSAPRCARG